MAITFEEKDNWIDDYWVMFAAIIQALVFFCICFGLIFISEKKKLLLCHKARVVLRKVSQGIASAGSFGEVKGQ